jgi:hypothetical protein
MSKQERTRKSSPQNRAKSFAAVMTEIEPSSVLDADEYDQFQAIIGSRERETWTPADIITATALAQIEIERDRVRAEYLVMGHMLTNERGVTCLNPLFTAYNMLFGQINRARRDLGLSASQRSVSGHKQAKRNTQDRIAADKVSSLAGLIARPDGK